jgi:uncharacterized protein involved in cysteine biosynthesis
MMSLGGWIFDRMGWPDWLGFLGGGVLFGAAWLLAGSAVFVALAGLIAGLFAERISLAVEEASGFPPKTFGHRPGAQAADTALRLGQSMVGALAMLLIGLTPLGIPAAILIGGWLGAMEFTSASFSRRGWLAPDQAIRLRRLPGAWGFVLGSGLISLLPVVNALALPALIAGGALLVGEADRAGLLHSAEAPDSGQ